MSRRGSKLGSGDSHHSIASNVWFGSVLTAVLTVSPFAEKAETVTRDVDMEIELVSHFPMRSMLDDESCT